MKVKIKREKLAHHLIWKIYDESGNVVDFYDRDEREDIAPHARKKGLTKEELIDILTSIHGYQV